MPTPRERLHDVLDNLADLAAVIAGPRPGQQSADPDDLFTETKAQEFERRLHAVEMHLQHLPPERGA
jgi:hypothetical protein